MKPKLLQSATTGLQSAQGTGASTLVAVTTALLVYSILFFLIYSSSCVILQHLQFWGASSSTTDEALQGPSLTTGPLPVFKCLL